MRNLGKGVTYHEKICRASVCPSGHGKNLRARIGGYRSVEEAKNYEEFRNAYMDYVEADTELETSKTVAHIRNTINLLDEFYEAEMVYFNSQMPKYEILKKEMGEVIVASPV